VKVILILGVGLLVSLGAGSVGNGTDNTSPGPVVQTVSLPAAGTYGTGSTLSFVLTFNESVSVSNQAAAALTLPVEISYAMRKARYVSGSGTQSLTFSMNVTANDRDTDGISLGRVNSAGVRGFDFTANSILNSESKSALNTIPAVNTQQICVDATGPVVTAWSGPVVTNGQMSLEVTFDGPVTVIGEPKVPVSIGNDAAELRYVGGGGTATLRFTADMLSSYVGSPTFRKLVGEVIYLPQGADLKDSLGNSVTPIGGDFGKIYRDSSDNRVVVIGSHYEALRTGESRVTKAELYEILNAERDVFNPAQPEAYWQPYHNPVYLPALYDVDLYRVAYRSIIPEQGNRPTVTYGLVAIPHLSPNPGGPPVELPMVSVQHGTLWLKESAPSQAFSWKKNSTAIVKYNLPESILYNFCYETRLNVAQFAGQGFAVIAADYFGIGNSIENDSFVVKQSEQQACLGMLTASQQLLLSKNLTTSRLFLNGWSQGALVSISFQEALEARGVAISGVSTAATPANTAMFSEGFIFNRRPYSTLTVPDAPWAIFVHQFSSFALASYSGQTSAPLELFGGNYDFSRKFYMREFESFPSFEWQMNVQGDMVPVMVMDGITRDAEVSKFLDPNVVSSVLAYRSTAYAKLIDDVGSWRTRLVSDMKMYYGDQDEGYSEAVCIFLDTWQRSEFGKTNIEQVKVPYASHRSTFLTAVSGQIEWFNAQRGLTKPTIITAPAAAAIVAGQTLADSVLSGGVASVGGANVAGNFAFTTPSAVPGVGTSSQQVFFAPTDMAQYTTATANVIVTVNPAGPSFESAFGSASPTAIGLEGMPNLVRYGLGANSPTDGVVTPTSSLDANTLSITAVVRINEPKVTVKGESGTTLGTWDPTLISGVKTPDQTGATSGATERQIFSVQRGSNQRTFLRLKIIKSN